MRDRIRKIMESRGMTQQEFAMFLGLSPATLSSIYNGRTRPTLAIVEMIKEKIPEISTDWLLFGKGEMKGDVDSDADGLSGAGTSDVSLEIGAVSSSGDGHSSGGGSSNVGGSADGLIDFKPSKDGLVPEVKYIERPQRKIVEIKIYYDDSTYETFVPGESK